MAKRALRNFVANNSGKNWLLTALGAIAAGLLGANINYAKLAQGDHDAVVHAVTAVIVALLGYVGKFGPDTAKAKGQQEEKDAQ